MTNIIATQEDRDRAMRWIVRNLHLAKGMMKSSADTGRGYDNFRAHEAHNALMVAKAAIEQRQRDAQRSQCEWDERYEDGRRDADAEAPSRFRWFAIGVIATVMIGWLI